MLVKINLMNEVCQLMGKYSYLYEPHIDIQIGENGEKKPKVVCRAYPDVNNRAVYNSFDYGDLVNLYYNIMQRWEDYLYDEQPDPQDRYIFGMDISEYWKHLGNSHLFLNGIYNLVDTPYDITPIIEKGGKPNGTLHYSLIPRIYHRQKEAVETQSLMKYDSLEDVEDGRHFGFDLVIEQGKGLPPEYCYKTFARYKLFGQVCETDIVMGGMPVNSDPKFSFKKTFKFKMNKEIRNKLKSGVLVVDMYGQPEQQQYIRLKSKLEKHKQEGKGEGDSFINGESSKLGTPRETLQATTRRGIEHDEDEDDEEIAKLMQENEKLRLQLQKKGTGYGKRNSCCCIIF